MRILTAAILLITSVVATPARAADAKGDVVATIGDKDNSRWSETTDNAAATPQQKAVLKRGKVATVVGEVIDVSCFLQMGKRGEKHIACGTKCINAGQPIGIVDDSGHVYTLFVEGHDPRRDGQADIKATFLSLLAKRVSVTGMVQETKGARALFVDDAVLTAAK